MKKIFQSGAVYFLIAILFVIGAVSQSISRDLAVVTIQWFCAGVFAGMGIWRVARR